MFEEEKDKPIKINNLFKNYLNTYSKRTRLLIAFMAIGLILFLTGAAIFPFKDKILDTIYPKKQSQAVDIPMDNKYGVIDAYTPAELTALKLPNPPLFSYYLQSNSKIHTFTPEGMGGVDKKNVTDDLTNTNVTIYQEDALKDYIKAHPYEYWTVFNESEQGLEYWGATPKQYAKIYHRYIAILKDVFGGDTSKFNMFFAGLYADNAKYKTFVPEVLAAYKTLYPNEPIKIDIFTVHIYPGPYSCGDPSDSTGYTFGLNATKGIANDFINFINGLDGGRYANTPIWLTEWGWIGNHEVHNNKDTILANSPCISKYIYDVMKFLETDQIVKNRITKVFYFPHKASINNASPAELICKSTNKTCTYTDGTVCGVMAQWWYNLNIYTNLYDDTLTKQCYPSGFPYVIKQEKKDWPVLSGSPIGQDGQITDPGRMYSCIANKLQNSNYDCSQLPKIPENDGKNLLTADMQNATIAFNPNLPDSSQKVQWFAASAAQRTFHISGKAANGAILVYDYDPGDLPVASYSNNSIFTILPNHRFAFILRASTGTATFSGISLISLVPPDLSVFPTVQDTPDVNKKDINTLIQIQDKLQI